MKHITLCTLVAAVLGGSIIAGVSFGIYAARQFEDDYKKLRNQCKTLIGTPIGFNQSYTQRGFLESDHSSLAIVIELEDGKKVLAYTSNGTTTQHAEARALIHSKMNDKEDKRVELEGLHDEDRFRMQSIKVNSYKVFFANILQFMELYCTKN